MRVGTKSILFGAHAVWMHPFMVAWAWYRLHGFKEVRWHHWTEKIEEPIHYFQDPWKRMFYTSLRDPRLWLSFFLHDIGYWQSPNMDGEEGQRHPEVGARLMGRLFGSGWHAFTLLHSRFYADRVGRDISPLCVADKYAQVFTPAWLYVPMARATGEIEEYMRDTGGSRNAWTWWKEIQAWAAGWVDDTLAMER